MKKQQSNLHNKIKKLLVIAASLASADALCVELIPKYITDGYSGCVVINNGNGTTTFQTSINYRTAVGNTAGKTFHTRGILLYTYNKHGTPTNVKAQSVSLNGVSTTEFFVGNQYLMYHNSSQKDNPKNPWITSDPFVANISVTMPNTTISEWPAIGIRAGNYTSGDDVAEIRGAAYISGSNTGNNTCKVINQPEKPPPLDVMIEVNAPDWNLGELPLGDADRTFTNINDQLCFRYTPSAANQNKFIINASNQNGISNNHYRLQHLNDSSQNIPYRLTLNDGNNAPLMLPNTTNNSITLDASGRTCFSPTFSTSAAKTLKEGDYADILNFTVITKP